MMTVRKLIDQEGANGISPQGERIRRALHSAVVREDEGSVSSVSIHELMFVRFHPIRLDETQMNVMIQSSSIRHACVASLAQR